MCGPSKEELHKLADELGLHELAVEDALGEHQRPKLDHYETHLFLSSHAVRVDDARCAAQDGDRRLHQPALAHHRPQGRRLLDGAGARAAGTARRDLAKHGVSFLLYGLLDVVVDGYFDDRPGVRRLLRRGQRGDLLGATARSGEAAPLVRDAPVARAVPPPRRADAGSGEQPDATRAHRRRRGAVSRTSRTSTTTSCASANRPTRCATSSARSSRPTSACATTARTRS